MTDHPKDGGPAFPAPYDGHGGGPEGMSLRAYAAIQLRQPDSGIDWLDNMIRNARSDDLAGQALAGNLGNPWASDAKSLAKRFYEIADAMLAAQEGK